MSSINERTASMSISQIEQTAENTRWIRNQKGSAPVSIAGECHATFAKYSTENLNMKLLASDLTLFSRRVRSQVTGLIFSYGADTQASGDRSFSQQTQQTREKVEETSREYESMRFPGVYIDKNGDNGSQKLPRDTDFVKLRRVALFYSADLVLLSSFRLVSCSFDSVLSAVPVPCNRIFES